MVKKTKIAIVEDEKIVALDLEQRLINMGFEVVGLFSTGDALLRMMPKLDVDLLLMDINLNNGVDGIEIYEQLKNGYTVPVIFATAYSDHVTLARAKKLEPYGYIVKPYDDQELYRTIDIGLYKFNMELELKEREEILRCITDSANDSIMMLDEKDNVIFWNKVAENCFGYALSDIYGMKWHSIFFNEGIDQGTKKADIPDISVKRTFEILARNSDGHGLPMEVSVLPVKIRGDNRTICVMKDISARLMKDAELKRTKVKAEISDHAKQIFLSNISHELRTPLNGIIGMTELLSETQVSTEQRQYIDILQKSSTMLLDTVNDILDITKLETGKLELEYKKFSLKTIILKIVERYAYESRNKDLTINYEIDDSFPEYYFGDEFRVQQIITNVVDNAIKFTEKGNVTIKATSAKVRYEYNEPMATVCIVVSDTGIGIHEKDMDSIFNSFSQVDGTITRHFQGAGLGLNLVRRLVEIMNGYIDVDSVLGKGSEFKIYFDLVISTELSASTQQLKVVEETVSSPKLDQKTTDFDIRQLNVLVAEDNLVGQQVMSHILGHKDIQYKIVNNGLEALVELKKNRYDIIFMDIEMPEMDGITAAIEIRKGDNGSTSSEIPIVALTGHSTVKDKARILASGINDLMIKPVRIEDVYDMIHKMLDNDHNAVSKETSFDIIPEMFKDEEELYMQLVQVFLGDAQERMRNINTAFDRRDWSVVEKESHSLKGSASYVEADKITKESTTLNNMMKEKEYQGVGVIIDRLNGHLNDFVIKINRAVGKVE